MNKKIFSIFFLLSITYAISSFSQDKKNRLDAADSLFKANNHKEALKIYEEIFRNKLYSPAMLLKMAYIQEKQNNIPSALYYLSSYYNFKPSRQIHEKMELLAAKNNLKGYDYTDLEYFNYLYKQYYYYIIFIILSFCGLYFAHLILKKIRGNPFGIRPIVFISVLFALIYVINFNFGTPKAIVNKNNVAIMSFPAAGSDLILIVSKGQRFRVIGKEDIWLKIEWENNTGFVRESDVWKVGNL